MFHNNNMKRMFNYFEILFIVILLIMGTKKYYSEKSILAFNNESYYIENYSIVDKNIFKESFINYLYKNNDEEKYLSKIYDYNTKEELKITDLIKKECIEDYYNKINELLYLKYPYFIADELIKNYGTNSYIFKDNELIIYFNDYNIEMDELLLLHVNYNEIYKYLNFSVLLTSEYKNESGYDYKSDKKTVSFTFDDSPNKNKTNRLVEILDKNYATATFFMIGEQMKQNKDLVNMVYNSHNEIGSHTFNHKNLKRMTLEEINDDSKKVNDLYYSITNDTIKLFRPPYGIINNNFESSYSYILWSLDTLDWKYRSSDYIINKVLDSIQDGDIILFHDKYDSTINAVEELLPILYKKGYQVVSVTTLANLKNKTLEANNIYHNIK